MKKIILILIVLSIKAIAMASGAEHGAEHEVAIPYSTIGFQALNLGILLVGIFFAIRKSVAALFQTRFLTYNDQARKTAEAAKLAEAALSEIKGKIQNLHTSEAASVENAKKDAEVLKNKIVAEAKAQSEKIKSDTHLIIAAELNNAKNEIRKEIINASMEIAKINIKASSDAITKKSEKGFLQDLANTKNQVNI